jgi:hypothetical protein
MTGFWLGFFIGAGVMMLWLVFAVGMGWHKRLPWEREDTPA